MKNCLFLLGDVQVRHLPTPVMQWGYNGYIYIFIYIICICIQIYINYIYICIKRSIPQEKWFTLVLRNTMKQEIRLYFMEEEQTSSLGTRGKPERNMSTKHQSTTVHLHLTANQLQQKGLRCVKLVAPIYSTTIITRDKSTLFPPIWNTPIVQLKICGFIPYIHHGFWGMSIMKGGRDYLEDRPT